MQPIFVQRGLVKWRPLARLVLVVRQLIGDSAREPRFIRTVHGYGYAFSGEASELSGRARAPAFSAVQCRLIWGEREIALSDGENVLG